MKKSHFLLFAFFVLVGLVVWQGLRGASETVFWAVSALLQILTLFFSVYQIAVGYLGLRRVAPIADFPAPEKKFAVLVCAHNEEAVVGQIVDNLKSLDYPQDLYDVFVICDNCDDETANIVRARSGVFAMERKDAEKRGKGHALEWMFKHLWQLEQEGKTYDAVVVFDADNLAAKTFLKVVNAKMLEGHEVVQGFLDAKNPDDTWVTKSYAFSYWATNRTFQLSREHLGLSAQLGGTGLAVTIGALKEFGWGATSLTEDLEFTQRYMLSTGKRVAWAHDAKIYDEKPLAFQSSWKQRIRWMSGHADCMIRYTVPLIVQAWRQKKLLYLDSAVYLMQPYCVVAYLFFMLLSGAASLFGFEMRALLNHWVYGLVGFSYISLAVVGILMEKKPRAVLWLPATYAFSLSWFPIIVIGLFERKNREWSHTKHIRKLSDEEHEKLKNAI